MEERYEEVKGLWEERFEASYGRWRGVVDAVVYAFLDRGGLEHGFARTFCDTCKRDYLLAFSCSRRGFCPSCAAKRGVICGAFLREEVVEEVGHCLWTFTVPKLLRPSCHSLATLRAASPQPPRATRARGWSLPPTPRPRISAGSLMFTLSSRVAVGIVPG